MESVLEVIDFSRMGVFFLWVVIPVFILAKSYLAKKFFSTVEFTYLILSCVIIGAYEGVAFSIVYTTVLAVYVSWWSVEFKKYREENPGEYEEYRKFYSEYYGDDLNGDGIKDAFEEWEIAHDPRLFWLFGSKMAKRERKLQKERNSFYSKSGFNGEEYYKGGYHGDKSKDYSKGAGSSFTKDSTQDYQNSRTTRNNNSEHTSYHEPQMSEAERKVARQHELAKLYNLRYFAMCETKDEAKKLYRKYATKFHPDNAVTGDKEKFIAVDEEYNRFCKISEIS